MATRVPVLMDANGRSDPRPPPLARGGHPGGPSRVWAMVSTILGAATEHRGLGGLMNFTETDVATERPGSKRPKLGLLLHPHPPGRSQKRTEENEHKRKFQLCVNETPHDQWDAVRKNFRSRCFPSCQVAPMKHRTGLGATPRASRSRPRKPPSMWLLEDFRVGRKKAFYRYVVR
mgnify:CR=1 FL=1